MKDFFKKENKTLFIVIAMLLGIIVICGTILFIYVTNMNSKKEKKSASEVADGVSDFIDEHIIGSEGSVIKVDSKTSLEDVIKLSQLHTVTYYYNSICDVKENHKVVYHVRYEGTVVIGIDVADIECSIDEEEKIVHIALPDVSVQSCDVDASSLGYIFVDNDYNTGSTGTKAQALCEEDLEKKIPEEGLIFDMARENTKAEVEALTEPIIGQMYSDYELEVEFKEGN